MKTLKAKFTIVLLFLTSGIYVNGQFKTIQDSLDYELHYKKYYDCKYEPGYVLIVQKKGKIKKLETLKGRVCHENGSNL
ncbi:hypothetical protein [Chryseobacterium sp.]|uniref:hypothetical protein n=1 Tax=Chryseobacterium sp. TaxID=1871047 RepID=UPI002899534C|nr:hypothetical protein [Chryseobacterium sp.]